MGMDKMRASSGRFIRGNLLNDSSKFRGNSREFEVIMAGKRFVCYLAGSVFIEIHSQGGCAYCGDGISGP